MYQHLQAYQNQRIHQTQQETTGSKKDTCGKEYINNLELTCTFHNRHMTVQTSPSSQQNDPPSSRQQTATGNTESMTIGQPRPKQHWTYLGQDPQTFKKTQHTRTNTTPIIEEEEQQQAIPAKGIKSPEQPTPQERAEHNLTHLPFRSWCPLCVQSKGKADAHKQQKQTSTTPVLQFDFCDFKTLGEIRTTPILTGIDVETGMAMAVVTDNKSGDFTYHVQAIQAFLLECGRVQASNTQQHSTTVRPRGPSHRTTQSNSS